MLLSTVTDPAPRWRPAAPGRRPQLPDLLCCGRSPSTTVVGFSWDAADEKAMQATFRIGRAQAFGHFLDLQQVRCSSVHLCPPPRLLGGHCETVARAMYFYSPVSPATSGLHCWKWAAVATAAYLMLYNSVLAAAFGCRQSSKLSFAYCILQQELCAPKQELTGCNCQKVYRVLICCAGG